MGSCGDDQRQPPRCGQSCSPGCTHCRHVTPCVGVADPGARHGRTSSLSCKASCGQPIPKSVAATPPVIPCVRTAEPWIRRRRTLPSSCHSLRADNRARASSRTHLSRRVRPPRVQTAHLSASSSPGHPHPAGRHLRRGHSTRPGACPSGRGHSTPSGTAIPSPNASPVPGRTEMSPHAQDAPGRCTLRGALGSQATGTASGPVLITVARSDLMTPTCTARRWGSTGGGSGVLRVGGAFVQYAQPPGSRSPPSCSRPRRRRPRPEPASKPQPPDPTQTLEGTRQGRRGRPRAENPRFAATTRQSGSGLRP